MMRDFVCFLLLNILHFERVLRALGSRMGGICACDRRRSIPVARGDEHELHTAGNVGCCGGDCAARSSSNWSDIGSWMELD